MPIIPFESNYPQVAKTAFIAPDAWLIGKVFVAENVSVFFGSVLRGDLEAVHIGNGSNIQEHCVFHTTHKANECIVGRNVSIGHRVTLHSCEVRDSCIIGMCSTIMDGAVIGENCIVGANSLITKGTTIPPGSLVFGSPAKVVRPLEAGELEAIAASAERYQKVGFIYRDAMFEILESQRSTE